MVLNQQKRQDMFNFDKYNFFLFAASFYRNSLPIDLKVKM